MQSRMHYSVGRSQFMIGRVFQQLRLLVAVASGIVAVALTGCGIAMEKAKMYQEFGPAMQSGHSYRSFYEPGDAMAPTVVANTDYVLVDESAYVTSLPQRGDIVVFAPPIPNANLFMKRILAVPGDRVAFHNGRILVNGTALPKTYPLLRPDYELSVSSYGFVVDGDRLDPADGDIPGISAWTAPDRLPRDCFFAVGDNINNSEDSHIFGCARFYGTFASGPLRGESANLSGKVVKIAHMAAAKS
jgi:signal peptidase I